MIFLSSLPRSGSTLLTSLLNQRPDVYASPTSNLCETMGAAVRAWEQNPTTQAQGGTQKDLLRILQGIMDNRYNTDKLVFDKGRGWAAPQIIDTMAKIQSDVKIVAMVRPVAECLASFIQVSKVKDVKDFCKNSHLATLFFNSYASLKAGYEAYPDNFLLIDYHDLINDTQRQMDKIASFVGVDKFTHDRDNVPPSNENDEAWGIENLHDVRSKVSHDNLDAKDILGETLFDFYQGGEFWNDKPDPVRGNDALDLQLEASLRGEFEKAGQITDKLLTERPNCNRVKFNAGWHKLYAGDLQEGHKYLDCGRDEDVFGNKCLSGQPRWNGEQGTVLLNLEGGLGDQIKSYRFASEIEARDNRVVVACSAELAPMFAERFITVQHEAVGGVYHDYWMPSMSVVLPLGHTYKTLSGKPYINRTAEPIPGKVGIRWSGNPQFEHEQHRVFPKDLMFNAVRDMDCLSLQRDTDDVPDWMGTPCLDTWADTRKAISECELVISSCTSIAHLAAAMGIKTFIVVPILSYYLWALPGDKTPYYDSVTLFRQKKYGDWSAPFEQIKEKLKCMRTLKTAA
jgi:hypothetical protein